MENIMGLRGREWENEDETNTFMKRWRMEG
jgi:hypothetical protein